MTWTAASAFRCSRTWQRTRRSMTQPAPHRQPPPLRKCLNAIDLCTALDAICGAPYRFAASRLVPSRAIAAARRGPRQADLTTRRKETMSHQNFTTTFTVDQTPEEAFAAINNVRGWWSGEIEGSTEKLGDEFTYRYKDVHYSKQKITEVIPGKKVVWLVLARISVFRWTTNLVKSCKALDRRGFGRDQGGAEVERRWVRHKIGHFSSGL